jgi:hypothetical protein
MVLQNKSDNRIVHYALQNCQIRIVDHASKQIGQQYCPPHTVTLAALGYEGKLGRGLKNFQISSCFSTSCKIKVFLLTFLEKVYEYDCTLFSLSLRLLSFP